MKENAKLVKKYEELRDNTAEMTSKVEDLQDDRDYYYWEFQKCRTTLQEHESKDIGALQAELKDLQKHFDSCARFRETSKNIYMPLKAKIESANIRANKLYKDLLQAQSEEGKCKD